MTMQTVSDSVDAPVRPVREEFLPFNQPDITQAEIDEVVDTLRSGWITTGPKTKEFERRFAEYVGVRHAIAVNSCTGGLHVALAAADIGPGDEVIVPTMTFCSTANVVVHLGATPVIVDVEPDTLNIAPRSLEAAITPQTKAVIPVHLYGHPCDMDRINEIARAPVAGSRRRSACGGGGMARPAHRLVQSSHGLQFLCHQEPHHSRGGDDHDGRRRVRRTDAYLDAPRHQSRRLEALFG